MFQSLIPGFGLLSSADSTQDINESIDDVTLLITSRTPKTTGRENYIQAISQNLFENSAFFDKTFLGVSYQDWFSLTLSIFASLFFTLVITPLLFKLVHNFILRREWNFLDSLINKLKKQILGLIFIGISSILILSLNFWSPFIRLFIEDFYYLSTLGFVYSIIFVSINSFAFWYRKTKLSGKNNRRLKPMITLISRLANSLVAVLFIGLGLTNFGVDTGAVFIVLLFIGILVFLAVKAVLADLVSGVVILIEQPFNVGDTLYVQSLDARGKVSRIGLRSTSIITEDGKAVIFPNSIISQSQITNFDNPVSEVRVKTEVGVVYGSNVKLVKQALIQAAKKVDEVEKDKPIEAFFMFYGDYSLNFRLQWWIKDNSHRYSIVSQVNENIQQEFKIKGIEIPFPIYDININKK